MTRRSSALPLLSFLAMVAMADEAFDLPFHIDCGSKERSVYMDCGYDLDSVYTSDNDYVDSGIEVDVRKTSERYHANRYSRLRSFPNGARNCYTVRPVTEGDKYLVRAEFFYGNYDGKNSPPNFDLYLGVNFWQRVETMKGDPVWAEIIVRSPGNSIDVCLVNTGSGTPFISILEAIKVDSLFYSMVNSSHSLVLREKRINYGGTDKTCTEVDAYDRTWFPSGNQIGWTFVSTDKTINREEGGMTLPHGALSRAIVSERLSFRVTVHPNERNYLFLYFAELEELGLNETREFYVLEDGKLWYGPYRPKYLKAEVLHSFATGQNSLYSTSHLYSLNSTSNSTRPPIINAREVYSLKKLEFLPTDSNDRDAMWKIKQRYGVKKNWQGDPCFPSELSWEGVGCRYDNRLAPRIISLNLSMSGVEGEISPSLANLTALMSLDLSNNNLKGKIIDELVNLQNLKVLDLSNNRMNGPLPDVFCSKSKSGKLLLSIYGNAELCKSKDFCQAPNKETGISASAILVIILAVCLLFWLITRKQNRETQNGKSK